MNDFIIEIMRKNNLNLKRWRVLEETENEIVFLSSRGRRRTIKKEEEFGRAGISE